MKSREVILDILYRVFHEDAYASLLLRNIKNNESIGFISEVVYGTIRNYLYLEKQWRDLSNKVDLKTALIIDMSIYQLFFLDNIPDYAIINEAVNIAKKKSFVNAILRKVLRRGRIEFEDYNIQTSHPEWLIKLWEAHYGKDIAYKIAQSNTQRKTVYGRINTLKTNKEKISEIDGITFINDICFKYDNKITDLEEFKNGEVVIQDIHSQSVVNYLDVKENMDILDLCASPGTKTQQIAMTMNNKGNIIACDLYPQRCELINELSIKTGTTCIKTKVNDATISSFKEESFDRILMDVPCSGLGDLAHKPEIKWHLKPSDIDDLIITQEKILESNWRALKVNGLMVYSTCTLNKKENETQIKKFLDRHNNFIKEYENTLFPYIDNGDGFYICVLKRIA